MAIQQQQQLKFSKESFLELDLADLLINVLYQVFIRKVG